MIGWPMLIYFITLTPLVAYVRHRHKTSKQRELAKSYGLIDRSFRLMNRRIRETFNMGKWRE